MNDIRVKHVPEFTGEDVVLLAFDSAGLDTFLAALTEAQQGGSSRLHRRRRVHDFVIEAGAADIELADDRAVWRLSHAKAAEIIEKLTAMSSSERPGHHYVDDMLTRRPHLCCRATSTSRRAGSPRVKSRYSATVLNEQPHRDNPILASALHS